MCGITGVINFNKKKINARNCVEKINNYQRSRGPDGDSIWSSNDNLITFGHTRLSIIDLSNEGVQPFISYDQNYVITYNGEIYNYKELKNFLIKKNVKFKSNSDTEVILESYKYWGIDFLEKIRGMYAFCIFDIKKRNIILARDPFGIKPLYYSEINSVFYFASQAKSLLQIENIDNETSKKAIINYFLWGNINEPDTIYENIKVLKRGSYLIINSEGSKNFHEFANLKEEILKNELKFFKKDADAADYLKEILIETVKYHQVSDVPVSYLLSSGIDSTTILNNVNETSNSSALTVDFNQINESNIAIKIAKEKKIPHKIKKFNTNNAKELIETFFQKMDNPTNDGFNNFIISKLANDEASKVIISGIGGDEFFCGYPSFKRIPLIVKGINVLPNSKILGNLFTGKFYNFLKKNKFNTKYSGLYNYGNSIQNAFFLQRCLFLPHEIYDEIKYYMTEKEFFETFEEIDLFTQLKKDISGISNEKLKIMYLEIKYYLCSKLLIDADWTSMSNSVEMRVPFVDWFFFKKIIPILNSNIKIDKKFLLKTCDTNLRKELEERPKTGFMIPHETYLKDIFKVNNKYSHPIKDWSINSFKKFL
jgi:asparagine synthase (glutamine-hydrolysing)